MRGVFLTLDDPPAAFRLGITIGVTLTRPVSPRIDLPATALARQGRQVVRLAGRPGQGRTVALHEVTVLARDDDTVTVTAGSGAAELAGGARVVIAGAHSLAPGQAVKVAR